MNAQPELFRSFQLDFLLRLFSPPRLRRRRKRETAVTRAQRDFLTRLFEPPALKHRPKPEGLIKSQRGRMELYKEPILELLEKQPGLTGTEISIALRLASKGHGTNLCRDIMFNLTETRDERKLVNQKDGAALRWYVVQRHRKEARHA